MSEEKKLQATRTIDAPADAIFALLADPKQHVRIDGSGALQGSDSGPITGAGQKFTMDMRTENLGAYRTINTVTEYDAGRRIGWAPDLDPTCDLASKMTGVTIGGHTYVYDLRESGGSTEVTQTYDWSGVTDPQFEAICPFVSEEELAATLDRLADGVATA